MRENLFEPDGSCNTTKLNGIHNTFPQMTECVPEEHRCSSHIVNCNNHEKYVKKILLTNRKNIQMYLLFLEFRWRTYDGSCNNQANPKWGALNMEYSRLLNANYDDGIFRIVSRIALNSAIFFLFFFFFKELIPFAGAQKRMKISFLRE